MPLAVVGKGLPNEQADWQTVCELHVPSEGGAAGTHERTHRLRVPGGWLYRVMVWSDGRDELMNTVFVTDPG